jgi:hypothetical protein
MDKDINLDQFEIDYNNYMLMGDIMKKYNINHYYFFKIKRILKLDRGGKIGKLGYALKKKNIVEEPIKSNEEPIKPKKSIKPIKPIKSNEEPIKSIKPTKSILKANTKKNKKGAKVNINIKSINTDGETPEYEIKKCDTTYNNDKSKLLDALK